MGLNLSGPDGKPLAEGSQSKQPPKQMDRFQKFNMVYMIFTLMDRAERRELRKSLKVLSPKLDLMYPNGMSEGDIKRDMEKAALSVVPDGEENPVAPSAESGEAQSIPVQPEVNAPVQEVTGSGAPGVSQ